MSGSGCMVRPVLWMNAPESAEETEVETDPALAEGTEEVAEPASWLIGDWPFNGGVITISEDGTWTYKVNGAELEHGVWTINEDGSYNMDSEEYADFVARYDEECDVLILYDENGNEIGIAG